MRNMVEGCHRSRSRTPSQSVTPLRQAFGLPPPLSGEEEIQEPGTGAPPSPPALGEGSGAILNRTRSTQPV
jgi:hypothetical protein